MVLYRINIYPGTSLGKHFQLEMKEEKPNLTKNLTLAFFLIPGDIDFVTLSTVGNEEWMVAVDTSGKLYIKSGRMTL